MQVRFPYTKQIRLRMIKCQWSPWSECSANCGRGMRLRDTLCAAEDGGDLFKCTGDDYFTHTEKCNTWDKDKCPSACEGQVVACGNFQPNVMFVYSYECMEFAACIDESDAYDPIRRCECQMGKIFDDSGEVCVDPPPPSSTPRPIPTMAPAVKAVARGMQKTASTLLIIFVSITLALFAILRIYNTGR